MEDFFAVLGLPRRAALDEETLVTAFHRVGGVAHPDREGGSEAAIAEVNRARAVLELPESRLKHLLELEAGEQGWAAVPMDEGLMGVFLRLGGLMQEVEGLAKKRQAATSALGKALLAGEEMALQEKIEEMGEELGGVRAGLEAQLPVMDLMREAGDGEVYRQMSELRARLAYVGRWREQLREAYVKML